MRYRRPRFGLVPGILSSWCIVCAARAQTPALELRQADTVVLIGNTLAERMQYFNHFETLLMLRFPELQLRVRNLGWSASLPVTTRATKRCF